MNIQRVNEMAKALFREEREIKRLDGWFLTKETAMKCATETAALSEVGRAAFCLLKVVERLPLSISKNAVFAGTQRDAFARSYALINPSFRVENFSGYCDPTAVYADIEPNATFSKERIQCVKEFDSKSSYVTELQQTYNEAEQYTDEVAFFIEQVTGHVIPDVRFILGHGIKGVLERIAEKQKQCPNQIQQEQYNAMRMTMDALRMLAQRYASIARKHLEKSENTEDQHRLEQMLAALENVPEQSARNLFEAIQSFILVWQLMCLEQAPNPFAFSVGNADRIFEPYRMRSGMSRDEAAALFRHWLVFFNVADRSWAISQNVIIGGRDNEGRDLTNLTSYALLDAYYDMNLPQPILSVKLHKNTPEKLYAELGRFFFTPGCLTPSLFNDDAVFQVLEKSGIEPDDLPDYSIAGCQEPLIMGKDNGNTTNSWLNLGKILELTLHGGYSAISGRQLDDQIVKQNALDTLKNVRSNFYANVERYVDAMVKAANGATHALSHIPVPFLSTMMGGLDSGYDMRDVVHQGTKYNGSGCLIHGLSVVADSFIAIDTLLTQRPQDAEKLLEALKCNFEGFDELRAFCLACPKFGNNLTAPDREATEIAETVADIVHARKNELGNPFRPDFSTPSTHLLYGYWVGALPDGRKAREMLNYGVDPLAGDAHEGLGFRILSLWKLPFEKMCGGYASHLGVDPRMFKGSSNEARGLEFRDKVLAPLFFNDRNNKLAPFYLYVNVTTPEMLRKVLAEPKKYAPSGVYIMRIHGTFVNFLDLSPAIQQDIIRRLDPEGSKMQ